MTEFEQERLFEVPEAAVGPPKTTKPPVLVMDDEGHWSRAVSNHSAEKAYYVRRLAEIIGTGMRLKWPGKLWWIELFAGPGRLYLRETDAYVPGSPVEAVSVKHPFTGYVFADLDPRCVSSLSQRVERPGVHVLQGDANSASLLDRVASIVPRDALVVLYGDQEGLDLGWDTVKFLIDRYPHLDLLLNLPVAGAVRALAAGHDGKAGAMLGHEAPLDLVTRPALSRGASLRDWYWRKLAAEGYDHINCVPIKLQGRNTDLYDLMLASRASKALEFFDKATSVGPKGQYALSLPM
ncbi:MAG TPA: three-Cys-motif partner protein TcmP [Thermoleophilaceae bacterium]|nr:three-Cys-motif partner protein TcmP [Thermoleophilaceae bacterium]